MKKSKFTEAQIVFVIKQSDSGVPVSEICCKMGISEATFYNWKKKYGGLGVSELRQLRQLIPLALDFPLAKILWLPRVRYR
jgi:putative transposase